MSRTYRNRRGFEYLSDLVCKYQYHGDACPKWAAQNENRIFKKLNKKSIRRKNKIILTTAADDINFIKYSKNKIYF